ncbi:MAG: DEAD/DEAH box helicase, partial [Planctomycetota bacterium]|nr:DEAD/DEAH box helicase [Planctomycetota bacterium]
MSDQNSPEMPSMNAFYSPFDTFVSSFEMSTFALMPEPIVELPSEPAYPEVGDGGVADSPAEETSLDQPDVIDPISTSTGAVAEPIADEPVAVAVIESARVPVVEVEVVDDPVVLAVETPAEAPVVATVEAPAVEVPVPEAVATPVANLDAEAVIEAECRDQPLVAECHQSEPIAETVIESVEDPVTELETETRVEFAATTAIESIQETIADLASETDCAPVAATVTGPSAERVATPITEAAVEPVDEPVSEPIMETVAESAAAPAKEIATEAIVEPVVKTADPEIQAKEVPGPIMFRDLPLREEVQQAVQIAGYEIPTAVQAQIIPHMLEGRDVLAQSQTGTGKTAAFALPILSRIEIGRRKPQVLVLAPTRELAIQVGRSFTKYAGGLPGFSVATIYGGQDYEIQFRQLRRGVEVVVGTPGRVIDHIKRGTLDISGIDCLVLDEADEMLNMGFLEDVQFVLDEAPDQRQIALFSATLPPPIRNIAQRYLHDPARITIQKKAMTAESIRQRALYVAPRDRIDVLTRILEVEETDGVIVFTKTKEATVTVAERLNREGLRAIALNGDMPQKTRERAIDQLKSGHLDILVATDVAARGLDVTRVSHVFNYDVPQDGESYIHRVGRTGRAGRKGEAIIFLAITQRGKLRLIEQATKESIEVVQPPTSDDVNAMRIQRFKQRITDVTANDDLTLFKKIISEYAEESDKPIEMIAAALAHIGQGGRPFFLKDRPIEKQFERQDRNDRQRGSRQGADNFERQPRRGGGGSEGRPGG